MSRNLLFAQFGILAILAALHIVGTFYFLYWRLPWFDLISHPIGGAWSGLFAAWMLSLSGKEPQIFAFIIAALIFGISWESFELANGIIDFPADMLDSMKDLVMDIFGGVVAYYLAIKVTRI